ncbi:hypothetical protein TGRUB_253680 [Toxoplasma gondii RUB]|uniref:Uncharacterized protein n=9 Tax=Toxoplasma gondii TaxID=5811 RepID=S7UML9_TOXGG|nr:hypothetical protein TGGT1_253680 [Toxoplasma gondii GT1]KAF4645363.1 hypothetical protein TGRH88_004670 [Toxoplasma gondii]KFG47036.1 hypothetical protein TGP89_253680 [Toxoplasma gondii p89]KFG52918.1 hypothetical protein TGFOU_253680 [Toxoplasma gondii FOU]KFG60093.1 hypothetical protein TGRUB_253680 [Toxoplasma gondii RUB]KFH14952.1 hypothetical protein TGMAS_253680 [Toxoplasma gondii MAS]PIL97963.1 hypothetical protein TGCOUG_253680 [Toxoplasma gondii COUG]PUA89105.1 hypothetical pro
MESDRTIQLFCWAGGRERFHGKAEIRSQATCATSFSRGQGLSSYRSASEQNNSLAAHLSCSTAAKHNVLPRSRLGLLAQKRQSRTVPLSAYERSYVAATLYGLSWKEEFTPDGHSRTVANQPGVELPTVFSNKKDNRRDDHPKQWLPYDKLHPLLELFR